MIPKIRSDLVGEGGGGLHSKPCFQMSDVTRCLLGARTPVTELQILAKWELWVFFLDWVGLAPADFAGSGLDTLASNIRQQSVIAYSSIMDGSIHSGQVQQVSMAKHDRARWVVVERSSRIFDV